MGWITLISPHWYCVIVIYSNERVRESKWAVAHRFWFWRVSLIQTNTHTLLRSGFVCVPRLFLWHWRSCVNVCARVWMSMDSIRIEKFLLRIKCVLLFFTSLLLCRCVFFCIELDLHVEKLYIHWIVCAYVFRSKREPQQRRNMRCSRNYIIQHVFFKYILCLFTFYRSAPFFSVRMCWAVLFVFSLFKYSN